MYDKDYPQEYITGRITFFGRDFVMTPDVLIPRLETESLVRRARQILNSPPLRGSQRGYPTQPPLQGEERTIVVDIGCGSGIIGTSVADLADEVIFLDISPEALRVAEQNFRTHFPEKKAQFIVSDLLSNLPTLKDSNIIFVTNLPYIKDEDWENMSADTVYEPKLALFWWEKTGFEMYERLFEQIVQFTTILLSYYPTILLLYEFWFDQRDIAEDIVKKYPQWEYSFFADYAGIERFGEVRLL